MSSSQKKEIDEVYAEYFGYSIPYTDHILYTSISQKFDPFYIPAYVYISDVESVLNNIDIRTPLAIEDKNQLNQIASFVGIDTPTTIWGNVDGINFNSNHEIVSSSSIKELLADKNTVFVKPSVESSGGHDCKLYRDINEANTDRICKEILDIYKSNFVVQETCTNCESIKEIHPWSLNTLRVATYILHGEVRHMPCVMRVGCNKASVDNASSGGVVVAIDDTGQLGEYCATNTYTYKSSSHPDTGYVFADHKINEFGEVLKAAEKIHECYPQLKVINWDFTITEDGKPCLIEVNVCSSGGFNLSQIAHGKSAFSSDTEEIFKICKELRQYKRAERLNAYRISNVWGK